jgi:hypothetical protein
MEEEVVHIFDVFAEKAHASVLSGEKGCTPMNSVLGLRFPNFLPSQRLPAW